MTTGKTVALTRQTFVSNKRCNVYIIGMSAKRKEEQSSEIFEIIIAKNFSKLMTDTKPGISENTNQEKKNEEDVQAELADVIHLGRKRALLNLRLMDVRVGL